MPDICTNRQETIKMWRSRALESFPTIFLLFLTLTTSIHAESLWQSGLAGEGTSSDGSPVAYGGFDESTAFLYEPYGKDQSQLFIGCYRFFPDDFIVNTLLPKPKLMFSLIAKKGFPISYQACWQFCMFKNPRVTDWFTANYIGLLSQGSKCVCFNGLFERFTNVPIPTCTAPCTGQAGETCQDNTMQVYLPCFPGFYNPPYCSAQCPAVSCQRNEYPNSQYQNYRTTFCTSVNGDCIVGCSSGKTSCPYYTPICSQIGGQTGYSGKGSSFSIPSADSDTFPAAILSKGLQNSCRTVEGYQTQTLPTVTMTTIDQPWVNKITATATDVGYAIMYIFTRGQNIDSSSMLSTVVATFELKDLGFSLVRDYRINLDDVNDNSEILTTMGQNTYFAFGLDPESSDVTECHIYNMRDFSQGINGLPYSYKDFQPGIRYRTGDNVITTRIEAGSNALNGLSQNLWYWTSEILLHQVFICSPVCSRKMCACDGRCSFGCAPGYLDPMCTTKCPTGYYGIWCSFPCSTYCKNQMCDPVNGICTLGCSYIGLKGAYCTEVCERGTYGTNCLQQCSPNCDNPLACSYLDGTCQNGCKTGYYGTKCDTPCVSGTYGVNCSLSCGSCTNNIGCNRFTGECPFGCDGGKISPLCKCFQGFFGDKCQYKCGGCSTGLICLATDGCCVTDPNSMVSDGQKAVVLMISTTNDTYRDVYTQQSGSVVSSGMTTVMTATSTTSAKPTTTAAAATNTATTTNTMTTKVSSPNETAASPAKMFASGVEDTTATADSGPASLISGSTWTPNGITGWYARTGPGNTVVYNVSNQNPGGNPVIIVITPDRQTFTYANVTVYVPWDTELANMAVYDVGLRNTLRQLIQNINATLSTGMPPCGTGPPGQTQCNSSALQSPSCTCQKGFYGFDCSSTCGNCAGVNCKNDNGYCFGGCLPGYFPPYCKNKCPAGYYGDCTQTCGQCLGGSACDNTNGQCPGGCEKGYKPPLCQMCLNNYYDVNCTKKCGSCFTGAACNYTSGFCDNGCAAGYEAPYCWCTSGYWGADNCKNKCGSCTNSTGCDPNTGKCMYGCDAGFTTEWCNKTCSPGFYGSNCGIGCGHCSNTSVCDPVLGTCPSGCDGNLRPPKCICDKTTYSDLCKSCGNCGNGTTCDPDSGQCKSGCQLGYRPPMCKCRSKTYGQDCSGKCGNCANNADCDLVTGECQNGCAIGYMGKLCIDPCSYGLCGANCSQQCGRCANCQTCDPLTCNCLQGCKPGYLPALCVRACVDQTYGPLCKNLCGRCINGESCRKSDGKCLNGCMKAWVPPFCIDPCPVGFYGANCLATCGNCDKGDDCNKVDGSCPQGCIQGYVAPYCVDQTSSTPATGKTLKVCDKNYYGSNCHLPCGHCHNDNCDSITGLCVEGCKPGYHPLQCLVKCTDGWYGINCAYKCGHCFDRQEICRHTDGLCGSGCQPDWFGQDCNFRSYEEYQASLIAIGGSLNGVQLKLHPHLYHMLLVLLTLYCVQ